MELPEIYENKTIKASGIINIKRGPQFQVKGAPAIAMLAVLFLMFGTFSMFNMNVFAGSSLLIISFALFFYALDFHGFQFDRSTHRIRDYRNFMWIKFGAWHNINDFNSIHLTNSSLVVKPSYLNSECIPETFHYYHIKLVDETNKYDIFLAEYKNYYKAYKIAQQVAYATDLTFKDFVKGSLKRKGKLR